MTIAIYGVGGCGRELVHPISEIMRAAASGNGEQEVVFVDDNASAKTVCGLRVVRLSDLAPGDRFVIAVGDGAVRQKLEGRCTDAGLVPLQVIAPNSLVGPEVTMEAGAVICPFAMVTASATIGRQFQCNYYSYVAHDCVIGDYVTFGPRVCCNGNVHIEDFAYIGSGAVIRQGTPEKPLRIGKGAIVGMGAVVTRDVPPGAVVVGNPAKPLER